MNYASLLIPNTTILGDGNMKTALIGRCDVGLYVAKIVTGERTVNKFVFCYGEPISQEELFAKMEELSGEKIEKNTYACFLFLSTVDDEY